MDECQRRNITPYSRSLLPGIPIILVVIYFISMGEDCKGFRAKKKKRNISYIP